MITMVDPKTGTSTLSYHLTNVSSEDALFIGELMELFTDPANARVLVEWRAGRMSVTRENGKLKLVRLTTFEIDRTNIANN